jgi:ribulose-phosphate 3-epimerase
MPRRLLIAPSILSADFAQLGTQIHEVEAAGADWIHVDVMDGHFVPNITMGPVVVEACRRDTRLPLDVHLMVEQPARFLEPFARAGADHLTVHIEADPRMDQIVRSIRELGLRAGVSLNPSTPPEALAEVLPLVDVVLVMSVNPGYSGQQFMEAVLPKIRTLRKWIDEGKGTAVIEVDGGIDSTTAPLAAGAGAEVFVAAKAVFGHPQGIRAGVHALREALALAHA